MLTFLSIATHIIVRFVVIAASIAVYYALMPVIFPSEDANIGAGLIGFALVMVISAVWGAFDGQAMSTARGVLVWAVVAVLVGTAWLVGLAVWESDDGMTFSERLRFDGFLLFFEAGLVFVPALIALLASHSTRRPAD